MNRRAMWALTLIPLISVADEPQPSRDQLEAALNKAIQMIVERNEVIEKLAKENDLLAKRLSVSLNCA